MKMSSTSLMIVALCYALGVACASAQTISTPPIQTPVSPVLGGTGVASPTANAIYKAQGASPMAPSALSDNGTIVSSSESIDTTTNAHVQEIPNAGSTGTTLNKLAKLTGAPSTAVIATTSDTTGNVVGIVTGGAGATGNAQIAITGQASCIFDGAITSGHYAQVSTTSGGSCHDGGATFPTAGQIIGVIIANTNASPGTTPQAVTLFAPGTVGTTASSSGTVTSAICNGVTITTSGTCPPPYGIVNHGLTASASAGALTISLTDNTGTTPSSSSPVNAYFRNVTGTTGSWTQLSVTSSLSLTIPSGATMNVTSSTAFRLWVVLFNNGGSPALGVINCTSSTSIFPLVEGLASTTAISGSSNSSGVIYTSAGLTSKAYLIVGYVEWNSTGLTAGTWTTTQLALIQSFGPGVKRPGDTIQVQTASSIASNTSTSNSFGTGSAPANSATVSITPQSAANPVEADFVGNGTTNAPATSAFLCQIFRGASGSVNTAIGNLLGENINSGAAIMKAFDLPNANSAIQYTERVRNTDNATSVSCPYTNNGGTSGLFVTEKMG
jgi:hypothetical protein